MATRVVRVEKLSVAYANASGRHPILRNVSLDVHAGELVVVFGSSGVGKSTLLRIVCGLSQPEEGAVEFTPHAAYGRQGDVDDVARRHYGFVFQEPRLFPWRRVRKNVELGLEGLGLSKEQRAVRAMEVLSMVGLRELADRLPSQLSGGQRQRVGIARALAVRPDVLLMDEPFTSLDAITRKALQNEVLTIWETTHTAILFVTHDVHEAVSLADRVIMLAGRPANIENEYRVDLPRPRDPGDPAVQSLARRIAEDLMAAAAR